MNLSFARSITRFLSIAGVAGLMAAGCGSSASSSGTDGGDARGGAGGGGGSGGGRGDASIAKRLNDTFTAANSLAGYAFSTYADTMSTNLTGNYTVDGGATGGGDAAADGGLVSDAAVTVADAGTGSDGGAAAAATPTLEWIGTDGNPDMGALRATVTFTDYRQYVDIVKQIMPALDLSDAILKAQLKLVSSTPVDFPGGIQFHASAGASYSYLGNAGLAFGPVGTWNPILLDIDVAGDDFDPTQIVQLGIQVYSGDPPVGMTKLAAPITIVFEIDTITD